MILGPYQTELSLFSNRYEQCVTFDSFPTRAHEISYAAFGMLMMYVLPLAVFVFTYSSILCEISRRSKEGKTAIKVAEKYTTKSSKSLQSKRNYRCVDISLKGMVFFFSYDMS